MTQNKDFLNQAESILSVLQDLGEVKVTFCGAIQYRKKLRLPEGKSAFSIEVVPEKEGLLPVCVLIEGKDFVTAKVF